ncbi:MULTISPECIES: EpsG family protein [Bacillus]|uniref:EpsG family protein n=2 Tax=Bacillaceae TaxID=186817 RepID=UPI00065B4C51|nr:MULTISPECIES: EpsG family protein [Bacillus cereus group]WIK95789.1 EpsG family protein [Bacillus bombysepticus]EKS7875147.1 EpsG family protein [Bacillus cereus]KAA1805300.1 Transmembrane protein EpsG [Bacillus cereus]KMQ29779.1 hypothetical protein TU58_07285 [Bacillus cereus]MCD2336665.1 EpsG family protein [Bacillus cereus]
MFAYIFMLILSLLTLLKGRYAQVFYWLASTYVLLLAGFRYGVGTDYYSYERMYTEGRVWFSEPGLVYIMDFMKFLGIPVQIFFLVIAFLIQYLIYKAIKHYSDTREVYYMAVFFYISLYYFNTSLNTIRQFIAMGLFLINVNNIINKKFIKYNLMFIVTIMFHKSAIFFYPMYFLHNLVTRYINTNTKRVTLLVISFSLMFVRFDELIIKIISKVFGNQYSYYTEWASSQYLEYSLSWKMAVLLIVKLLLSIWLVSNKEKFIHLKKHEVIFGIYYISLILTFPLYPMLIFRRLLFYISITEIIIFALFIQKNPKAKIVFILFALSYYFANLLLGYSTPLPYEIRLW